MPASIGSESESSPWKYFPFELGECEDLENYGAGASTRYILETCTMTGTELSISSASAVSPLYGLLETPSRIDFTVNNMALRLIDEFHSYEEGDLLNLFGRPRTAPMRTYSGKPPGRQAPNYIVVPLDFCSSNTNVLSREICVMDFDQSFTAAYPPTKPPGIPARYMAPEVAIGRPASLASDVWALGCASSGSGQIVNAVGKLPEKWRQTKFDEEGFPVVDGEGGEVLWSLEEMKPLDDRVRATVDEPASLFINGRGEALEAVDMDEEPAAAMFDEDAALRVPYPATLGSMAWKPTAICIDGSYFMAYSDGTDGMLEAFPRIAESEASLLVDLLSKIFT